MSWRYAYNHESSGPPTPEASLLATIQEDAEARINASRRLRYLDRTLASALALISAFLIWMNVWPMVRPLCPPALQLTGLVSVGLSLLIMSVSILVYAGGYGRKSELFNECGLALSQLWREYDYELKEGVNNYTKYIDLYYKKLAEYPDSHEMVDYMKYRISRRIGTMSWHEWGKFRLRIALGHYYGLIALLLVTSTVVAVVWFVEFGSGLATCKA